MRYTHMRIGRLALSESHKWLHLTPVDDSSFNFFSFGANTLLQSQTPNSIILVLSNHFNVSYNTPTLDLSIAVVTRGTKVPKSATKAISKLFNRSRISSKSKSVKGIKSIFKTSTSRAPVSTNRQRTPQVSKTSSLGTVSLDLIEETDIETYNDDERVKRLIESVLAKKRDTQLGTNHIKTYRVYKHKFYFYRRYRYNRHYLLELSIDLEIGDRLIISFLYYKEDT